MGAKIRKLENKTFQQRKEDVQPSWLVLDAAGKTLGRFASEAAKILRGKHKATFTPHVDCGDGVIVINADKIKVTGAKRAQKLYRKHTGYVGGMRETSFEDMMERKPTHAVTHAIEGMVPHNRLGRAQLKKLRVFAGPEHNMEAQKPIVVNI